MRRYFAVICLLFFSGPGLAQPSAYTPTEILLLGTFHFDNPGLDVAKYENANVLTSKRQDEIKEVVADLKAFKPDVIFIEATPRWQGYYDSLFAAYKNNAFQLPANEIYQLGFRLAKELDLPGVICVDYREVVFPFDSLVKVMSAANQTDLLMFMKKSIDSLEKAHNEQLKKGTIKEILLAGNVKGQRDFDVRTYFEFLKAGGRDNHVGSFMASEWWRRNMVIYENILKRLSGKERRALVIFGSAHTALLHEFLKYSPSLQVIEVSSVLK